MRSRSRIPCTLEHVPPLQSCVFSPFWGRASSASFVAKVGESSSNSLKFGFPVQFWVRNDSADLFRDRCFLSILPAQREITCRSPKIDQNQSSRKRSALSFLDPKLDEESEFQRIGRGFTNLCYETSGRRPKNAILGRRIHTF